MAVEQCEFQEQSIEITWAVEQEGFDGISLS
jgi:hypothetical protein